MENYQNQIAQIFKALYPQTEPIFTTPPDPALGDLALPCFSLAKALKRNPSVIAEQLKTALESLDFIESVEVKGGFLNLFFRKSTLFADVVTAIFEQGEKYGSSGSGMGRKALIEHTSINPNASPHVGRARNAMIGGTLARLLRFEGYQVEVHYFVNDIGKQIAMLLLGAMDKPTVTFQDLLGIYIDINNRLKENPELEQQVFKLLYRLENGDTGIRDSFRKLVDTCIQGQTGILADLGIRYDTFDYESDYIFGNRTGQLLETLRKTGKLEEDGEGRLVLNQEEYNLPMKAPYLVLTRQDKTSLYPLRDIAYTIDKVNSGADLNMIVLGEDQKLYFRQICAVLDLLGFSSPTAVHYSFVLLAEGKMATRKGNVVLLEDFMQEARAKAADEITKRHGAADPAIARAIGYGAVKYAILRASNDKNVIFDWEAALSFEGDSGPYLQYGLARINSIFRKYGKPVPKQADYTLLLDPLEFLLAKELAAFPGTVQAALKAQSPHILANYAYSLVKRFSSFYHDCSILNAESEALKEARLVLSAAVRQVIQNVLELLGIESVEAM